MFQNLEYEISCIKTSIILLLTNNLLVIVILQTYIFVIQVTPKFDYFYTLYYPVYYITNLRHTRMCCLLFSELAQFCLYKIE